MDRRAFQGRYILKLQVQIPFMKNYLRLLIVVLFLFTGNASGQLSLFTSPPLLGGNGAGGTTFNLRAISSVFLDTIWVPLYGTVGASTNLQAWYNTTPINGAPTIQAPAWTQIHAAFPAVLGNSTTTNANGFVFSPVVIPGGLLMNAGSVYGFAVGITSGSTGSFAYTGTTTNLPPVGVDTFTNGFVTIYTGFNIGYGGPPPTPTNHVRQFTGGISFRPATGRDVRIANLISPANLTIGNNSVQMVIQNAAADPIATADIGYQLDNNAPITVNGYSLSSVLGPGQSENYSFSTPINILAPGTHTLKVWATNANGLGADNNTSNDTLSVTICTGISGVFTLGGPSADFLDFTDAVNTLNQCGINGSVTFNVNPGTYYGAYTLSNVIGSGGANQIIFASSTGVASDVILMGDTAAAATTRTSFTINNTPKVVFQNMTFRRSTVPAAAQGVLVYGPTSNEGQIVGCVFDDQTLSTSSSNLGLIYRAGTAFILNNSFKGFYYAAYLEGQGSLPFKQQNNIQNNTFDSYTYRAIYALNQDFVTIETNTITNFAGTSTGGAGIWTSATYGMNMSNNRITGPMSAYGILVANPNGDTISPFINTNRVVNNVISGSQASTITSTAMIPTPLYISGTFSTTSVPPSPRDAIEIANNTVIFSLNTTTTSTAQGGVYILGGTAALPAYSYIGFFNNHIEVNPISGSLPANFRLFRVAITAIIDSLVSSHNNYRMGGATVPNFFRNNSPVTEYVALTDWQTGVFRDTLSRTIDPVFLSTNPPIPSSVGFDNLGTPLSYVPADIDGTPRSLTTPDIGAYEFVGSIFSQISVTTLQDTLVGPNRYVTASITDSSSSLVAGSARMFYKKSTQSIWQLDTVPVIAGNNYTFTVNYTLLGGVAAMDTIQYYVAVRNATNTVTTSPLGGTGLYVYNAVAPFSVYAYKVLPVVSGTYRVGVSGTADFPTLTAAANFLSSGLVNGPATFLLIDSLYSTSETFPITIQGRPGVSSVNTITFKPDVTRSNVVVEGSAPGSTGLFVLRGVKWFTLDGSNNGTSSRNLTLRSTSSAATSAVVWLRSILGETVEHTTLKNLQIVGGTNTVTSTFGITAQGAAIATTGTGDSMLDLTIQNNVVTRAYYGIYARNTVANPGMNIQVMNNSIGSLDTASFVIFRGIDVQNFVGASIRDNEVFNLVSPTATTQAAIEVGGTSLRGVRINRNTVWGVKNLNTGGWGAYGINVVSGDSVTIDNNLIYDLKTVNYSNTSQLYNAFGIRLAGGLAHSVHYNSVYLYGTYTNVTTAGAAGAAFGVTATAVTGDVRNNIFAMNATSTTPVSSFNAVWVVAAYNFANLTLNNNAYHVDTNAQCFVGRVGTTAGSGNYATVADWKLISSVGNANNDNLSVPPVGRSLPPFVSITDLHIPAGTTSGIESGAVVISSLGTPNTDYAGNNRPAGTGTAPDMGAYEFAGIALPDIFPPSIDSVDISPSGDLCVATARTVTVYARDNNGGRGIDSVSASYTVAGVQQPVILLTRTAGTSLNGTWTGVIPAAPAANQAVIVTIIARDSLGNFAPNFAAGRYKDDYLTVSAGNDTTIIQGDTATLVLSTGFGAAGSLGNAAAATGTNCAGGFMFDLTTATSSLYISGFDINPFNTGSQTVSVYYISGTKNGQQANQAAWTLEGTYTINPTAAGIMRLNLTSGFAIPAGATYGVYLQYHSQYATGTTSLSNTDLSITNGEGFCTNWTVCCSPRLWVGTVYYGSALTAQWTTLGGTVVGSSDTLKVSPATTTTYIVTVTDSVCTKSDTVTVTVNPLQLNPDIGVSRIVSPTTSTVLDGATALPVTVIVKNYGTVPASGFDVEYRINGGVSIVTNSITQTINPGDSLQHTFTVSWTPTTAGPVALCANTTGMPNELVRSNDTSCVSLVSTVSVENLLLNNRLIGNVYPNPAESFVNFEFNEFAGKGLLEIHDKLGRVVASIAVDRKNGNVQSVRTENWAAGIYSYRFIAADQVQHGNLIVKH